MKKKIKYTTIPVSAQTKRKLLIQRAQNGYISWDSFMIAIAKILKDFKPELKEFKKC